MNYRLTIRKKFEDSGKSQTIGTSVDLPNPITVLDFKNEIKSTLKGLELFEVTKEVVYRGSIVLENSETVPVNFSGLEYEITLKK